MTVAYLGRSLAKSATADTANVRRGSRRGVISNEAVRVFPQHPFRMFGCLDHGGVGGEVDEAAVLALLGHGKDWLSCPLRGYH